MYDVYISMCSVYREEEKKTIMTCYVYQFDALWNIRHLYLNDHIS